MKSNLKENSRKDTIRAITVLHKLLQRKCSVKKLADEFDVDKAQIYSDLKVIQKFYTLKKKGTMYYIDSEDNEFIEKIKQHQYTT